AARKIMFDRVDAGGTDIGIVLVVPPLVEQSGERDGCPVAPGMKCGPFTIGLSEYRHAVAILSHSAAPPPNVIQTRVLSVGTRVWNIHQVRHRIDPRPPLRSSDLAARKIMFDRVDAGGGDVGIVLLVPPLVEQSGECDGYPIAPGLKCGPFRIAL